MNDRELQRRLEDLRPPDRERARKNARLSVDEAFGDTAAATGPPRQGRVTIAAAVAGIALALLSIGIATPPGQAATSWVAERLQIGDPGGPPSLTELRNFASKGTSGEGARAYVLASGSAPNGDRYEWVTFETRDGRARCFEFALILNATMGSAGCELLPGAAGLPLGPPMPRHAGLQISAALGNRQPGREVQSLTGRVSQDIEAVEVSLSGRPIPVELNRIPDRLHEALGIDRRFNIFVAFPEDFERGGLVTVTGLDDNGHQVASANLRLDPLPDPLATSEGDRER